MKRSINIALVCFFSFAGSIVAQPTLGWIHGAFAQLAGPFTANNVVIGGPSSSQVQDSSNASSYVTLPKQFYNNVGAITWSGSTIDPSDLGWYLHETASGTCSASSCPINYLNIGNDNINAGSSNVAGFYANHNFGGVAAVGNRAAIAANLSMNSTTGNGVAASYSALAATATAGANDNGTGGAPSSQIEAVNIIAHLKPAATHWLDSQGAEIDMITETGSSVVYKMGLQIAELASDQVPGTSLDTAIMLGNQTGALGWTNGIVFGGGQGLWPFISTAVAMTCQHCGTLASFIDMSGATFGASPIIMPQLTPASSSATCKTGGIEWDDSFIYICTATNTWKRATLATF